MDIESILVYILSAGGIIGLILGIVLAAKYKKSENIQELFNSKDQSSAVVTWGFIWLFIVGVTTALIMIPTFAIGYHVAITHEVKVGNYYIGDKKANSVMEIYKDHWDGFLLPGYQKEIRDLDRELIGLKKKYNLSNWEKSRIKMVQERIKILKETPTN